MSDKNLIKKVDTYKFGPFVFSLAYDREKLKESIIEAKFLYATIADIPILPNLAARLEEDLIKKSIFGTAGIEGNPLSEEAVNKILSQEEMKGKIERAEKQIQNLREAYQIIKMTEFSPEPLMLKEDLIRELHRVITKDCENIENIPGQYRNRLVKVGDETHGGVYIPPKVLDDIRNLMSSFVEWINSPDVLKEDAAVRACLAHYHIALIHPFENGNGRTARAIEAILLKSAGIKYAPHMLSNFYYKNLDDYFRVFSLSEQNDSYDITPFVEFFLKGLVLSLEEIRIRIFLWIREFTLRDYYIVLKRKKEITQRQTDLLNMLLGFREEFSLKDLFEKERFKVIYRNVSERTARRDLKLLEEKQLIKAAQKGNFALNLKVIDIM